VAPRSLPDADDDPDGRELDPSDERTLQSEQLVEYRGDAHWPPRGFEFSQTPKYHGFPVRFLLDLLPGTAALLFTNSARGHPLHVEENHSFYMTAFPRAGTLPCMAREKSTRNPEPTRGSPASAEKTIISIRMPIEILSFVEGESRARGAALGLRGKELDDSINITAQINRTLEAFRSWFGLPAIVADTVEKDRSALGLGRLEYLQYLVFRRYECIVKNGPGFDKDSAPEKTRR
jgi:hypothetical protein